MTRPSVTTIAQTAAGLLLGAAFTLVVFAHLLRGAS